MLKMGFALALWAAGASAWAAGLKAKDQFARLDGFRVHYQSVGSGRHAIVFLSGWGCDASLWRNQLPELARCGRLLVLDLPGHGRSDKPEIVYTAGLFVRAVNAVLDHAGVEKAVLAGHSMGGMVAYEFARRHKDKALALIWVEGSLGLPVQVDEQLAEFNRRAKEFRAPDYKEKIDKFAERLFTTETPAAVRREVIASILATPQHVLAGCQEGLADRAIFEPERLELPAFALFARYWKPERFTEIYRKYLPNLEIQYIDGCGHYPMLEKPEEVNQALISYLGRHPLK